MKQLVERLAHRAGRIALVGAAGVGKTRVAREVAAGWAQERGTKSIWVDLSADVRPAGLAEAMALALGVRHGPGFHGFGPPLNALGRCLVVLDVVGALPSDVAAAVHAWLAEAPSLRVLTVSRRQLGPPHHETTVLRPLPLPEQADVFASDAWALLSTLAPEGALDGLSHADAHRILAALDGNPLMLLLAAGRLELLAADDLLEGLQQPLELLRDPDHQERSLAAVLKQAVAAVTPAERSALARCSVFEGAFTPRDAAQLLEEGWPGSLDVLHRLVRSHLLAREGSTLEMAHGVRAFADALLTEHERSTAHRRHAQWASDRGRRIAEEGSTHEERSAVVGDLRAAARRGLARELPLPLTLECTSALLAVLAGRSPIAELVELADQVLALPNTEGTPGCARLQFLRAYALRQAGMMSPALSGLREARAAAEAEGDTETLARALSALANLHYILDDGERIEALLRTALELVDDTSPGLQGRLTSQLAARLAEIGTEDDEVDETFRRALAHIDGLETVDALDTLTVSAWHYKNADPRLSEALYTRVLAVAAAQQEDSRQAIAEFNLGVLAEDQQRDLERAARLLRSSYDRCERLGQEIRGRIAACELGRVTAQQGVFEEAFDWLQRGLGGDTSTEATFAKIEVALRIVAAPLGRHLPSAAGPPEARELPEVEGSWAVPLLEEGFSHVRSGQRHLAADLLARLRTGLETAPRHTNERIVATATEHLARMLASWRIDADLGWMQPPGEEEARELTLSAIQERILRHLLQVRTSEPSAPQTAAALFDVGWPGEQAVHEAKGNRVRVALSHLRSAGFRDLLIRRKSGWLLDPEATVVVVTPD